MSRSSRARRRKRREATAGRGPEPEVREVIPAADAPAPPEPAAEEVPDPALTPMALVAELAEHGLNVSFAEGVDREAALSVLERLAASQREETKVSGAELIALVREAKAAGVLIPEAEEPDAEGDEGGDDEPPMAPDDDGDELEEAEDEEGFDPLAVGIQIAEALLNEAKAGYIASEVEGLEALVGEEFEPAQKERLARIAAALPGPTGLPDVAEAYQRLLAETEAEG